MGTIEHKNSLQRNPSSTPFEPSEEQYVVSYELCKILKRQLSTAKRKDIKRLTNKKRFLKPNSKNRFDLSIINYPLSVN